MLLGEVYKLELHWGKVLRPKAGIMHLTEAYFSGPALAQANKINDSDYIQLDFISQLITLVRSLYIAKLSWGEVIYNKNNTITLKSAIIEYDPEIKGIPNLKAKDYLVIDTENHESEKHMYHMLYPAYVVNADSELYTYGR